MSENYTVGEENGTVSVCVDSGVRGGFETALTVSLTAEDGTACKQYSKIHLLLTLSLSLSLLSLFNLNV